MCFGVMLIMRCNRLTQLASNFIFSQKRIKCSKNCKLDYVPREANGSEDCLAKLGQSLYVDEILCLDSPLHV